jgi:hypothetical protein
MWRWHALAIVLTDGAGGSPLLTGLDAFTGQARWTGLIAAGVDGSYPTADHARPGTQPMRAKAIRRPWL